MNESSQANHESLALAQRVDAACCRFENAWSAGRPPRIEDYLAAVPPADRTAILEELIPLDAYYRHGAGVTPQAADYRDRFPELDAAWLAQALTPSPSPPPAASTDALPESGAPRETALGGPTVAGYEILCVLGRGGMGVVYQARHVRLNRMVALKMILASEHASPQELSRFRREAEAVAQLQHPHIVQIYEVGEQAGCPYLSLEFVDGGSLAHKLAGTPQPAGPAAQLVETLARAVHHAHQRGIIHRDLKPANILLQKDEGGRMKDEQELLPADSSFILPLSSFRPKITDFGLAKRLQSEPGASTSGGQTQTGALVGTPSYMAPEQTLGQTHAIGPATDVYALGAILYECLTGRPPFRGATVLDTLEQVRAHEPVPPSRLQPKVPRDLETICLKCLAKEPGKRYASAEALAEDLRHWRNGEPIQARPVSAWERTWRWARRRPAAAALLLVSGVAVLALGGVITGLLYNARLEAANRDEAQAKKDAQAALAEADKFRYFHHIAVAHAEWRDGDMGRVEPLLDACPVERRGWEWDYLKRLCHADLLTFKGHTGEVSCVAYSPDGKWLASGSYDKTVKIWDAATREVIRTLEGHTLGVFGVAFSKDGELLASASDDKTVRVWDAATGQPIRVLKGHTKMARSPAFSPDGKWLASASHDKTVKVWDLASGKELLRLCHEKEVTCVAFSPDGLQLASANLGGIVQVWDAETGKPVRKLPRHDGRLWSVTFSPDGLQLASAGEGGTVHVWDARTGQPLHTLIGHTGGVHGLAFSPRDGARLASTGRDQTVRVWDMTTGKQVNSLKGHSSTGRGVAFSPDGARLASASNDGTVKIWDARTDTDVRTFHGHNGKVSHVAFSPDGKLLASASWNGTVKVWDMMTGQVIHTLPGHAREFPSMAFSADGKWLAATGTDQTVKIWDVATGHEVRTLQGQNGDFRSVAFSPDGKRLASGSIDGTVIVWEARTFQEEFTRKGHSKEVRKEVRSLAFSPDGKWLASGSRDKTAKVWDVTTGELRRTLEGNLSFVYGWVDGVAFSPDGTRLALACGDFTVRVCEWETEKEPILLRGHTGQVFSVAFSPDGTRLASAGSDDQTIKIWDVSNGLAVLTLRGHSGSATSVAFSPDGTRLASASYDGTVKIWDARPLTPEVRLEREALSLLDFLFARSLPKDEVVKHLQGSQTISPQVRQKALELVQRYPDEPPAARRRK